MAYEKELIINSDNFSVCINSMQINYPTLDNIITKMDFINPDDKVNVFLNIESILRNISMVRDVERKIYMAGSELTTILSSKLINYAAHYKSFFRRNNLRTRVFLYMTDLQSDDFPERQINPDYRCYYLTKYTKNPKYMQLSEEMVQTIIPITKTILDFINDVYFVTGKNIDGSMIPYIIDKDEPGWKNIIVSSDKSETQYNFYDNFRSIYLKRGAGLSILGTTLTDFIADMTKRPKDQITEISKLYENKGFYLLLLSVLGDKYRTVDGISNIGLVTLTKLIQKGISENIVTSSTTNVDLLSSIFDDDNEKDLVDNFSVLNIETKYQTLTKSQINDVTSQVIDRTDVSSLQQLNAKNFYKHQLNLEALTQ